MQETEAVEVVRSTCSLCQNYCGLLAYRSNGQVIKLEGDPENTHSLGHLCAKGLSGFLNIYSPTRFKKPVRRGNPKKGIGIDPQWVEIGWEEAINLVADKVREVMKQKPGRIAFNTFDHPAMYAGVQTAWARAANAYRIGAGGFLCGTGVHPVIYLNTATFEHTADYKHVRYILLLGAQAGSIIHYDTMEAASHIAELRPGGIKVVSVDPLASYAGSKAEEWIPIRPGTDAALILAIANLLVNEYQMIDAKFLKEKTNAPYLIRPNGRYARDKSSIKPLVWDAADNLPKTFDDNVKEFALEGAHMVNGEECKPSFQLVKEHLRRYTPEYASEITTIQVETIRRIAREVGEAAHIGETITIDGVELPYRPISILWYRGVSSHKNSFPTSCSAMLLCLLLGAIQVPGAIRGHPRQLEYVTEDGMMAPKPPHSGAMRSMPYPPRKAKKPTGMDALELFPIAHGAHGVFAWVANDPSRFGFKEGEYPFPEIFFTFRADNMENTVSPKKVEAIYSRIPMMVSFALEPSPSVNMADIVFPDLHHLERLAETVANRTDVPGVWYAAKPVVEPPFDLPYNKLINNAEVFLTIAEKAGFLPQVYGVLNEMWELKGTPYELDPNRKYEYLDLIDHELKRKLGPNKGVEWVLSPQGGIITWKPEPQDLYPSPFRTGRIHLYYEFLLDAGDDVKKVTQGLGIPWDISDYQAIPDWKPCPSYRKRSDEFDLFITNYKVPMLAHGFGRRNPILRKLVESHNLDAVLINPKTAERKGIKHGDSIEIETHGGYKTTSVAFVTERVHPEVLATMQHKIRRGVEFNETIALNEEEVGFVNASVDTCTLAKVRKL